MDTIINKVSQSGLLTIDLETLYDHIPRELLDIKEQLYMGLMLKEEDFRQYIKENDWSIYQNKHVIVFCSSDAIVPTWAYMLISSKLAGIAKSVFYGSLEAFESQFYIRGIDQMDMKQYEDQRVVVKGCSGIEVPISAYVHLTNVLTPIAKSVMFGEPCSTVPIYKKALKK